MHLNTYVILEFRNICQPLLVRGFCCEFSVENVFCNELRICCLSGTTVVGILNRGFNVFLPTDPQHSLVIYLEAVISLQIITYSPVPLIRALRVDLFNFISDSFVFQFISRSASMEPFIVSSP